VAVTLFQESDRGKKEWVMAGSFPQKVLISRAMDMTTRTVPPQKGRKPGPGSFQLPISTDRA
jgi:hypothetical protein